MEYPPGTGFVFSLFPAGFQVIPLYVLTSVVDRSALRCSRLTYALDAYIDCCWLLRSATSRSI